MTAGRAQGEGPFFHPPLDIMDGAARIVDPIVADFNPGNLSGENF